MGKKIVIVRVLKTNKTNFRLLLMAYVTLKLLKRIRSVCLFKVSGE